MRSTDLEDLEKTIESLSKFSKSRMNIFWKEDARQMARWLKELKIRREMTPVILSELKSYRDKKSWSNK